MKTFCTCKSPDYICQGLWQEPLTFKYDILWVHHSCGFPFRLVWESYIRRCENCLNQACLPWETMCQKCFNLEFKELENRQYNGLIAAARIARTLLPASAGSLREVPSRLAGGQPEEPSFQSSSLTVPKRFLPEI